jgi:hypothetical protein
MKSNQDLGFGAVHAISEGIGDAGGTLTAHLMVGRKGNVYRAYLYLWHHEQDASREGVRDALCARSASVAEVLTELRRRVNDQWTPERARGARRAIMEIQESLDEDGEQEV